MDTKKHLPPPEVRLSRKEFADLFGVSNSTIKRRTEDSTLKPQVINSRTIYYTKDDVDRLIECGYHPDAQKAEGYGFAVPPKRPLPEIERATIPSPPDGKLEETEMLVKLLILHLRAHPSAIPMVAERVGAVLWQQQARSSAA